MLIRSVAPEEIVSGKCSPTAMDAHHARFRDAQKIFLLSLSSQYFLVSCIRFLCLVQFGLSIFVVVWLFAFAFYQHPDLINCKTIRNMFYPRLEDPTNWGLASYYDLSKQAGRPQLPPSYLNQSIKCTSTKSDLWSCAETYFHNASTIQTTSVLKENMNYFELTEYLNFQQKNAFGRNFILNCAIYFRSIDRLFNCWIRFTCDYKMFIILHSILFELGMHWFIGSTLKKELVLNRNGLLNFHFSLARHHRIMSILRYCQCLLILVNCLCYLLYGILPLSLPFAFLIVNTLQQDRVYVEWVNLSIISLKYLTFLLKSTNFFVAE